MRRAILATALAVTMLSGCSMTPRDVRPVSAVSPSWPVGDAYLRRSEANLPVVSYAQVFRDARLQRLIEQALANNRDLRVAAANIAAARAQYRIQRADRLPQVDAGAGASYSDRSVETFNADGTTSRRRSGAAAYSADVGVTAFELDLFGRVAALTEAERNRYFATEAAARTVRLTLVGDIADAWLTHAADASLLKIARDTAASAERSVRLTRARLQGGIAPRTDLRQAEQILSQAQSDLAEQTTALAQDANALQLLVGAPIDPALLPTSIEQVSESVTALPAGLDSQVLLRRPDVVEAEYTLRAANADIGAARAALFPRITLTGLLGFASNALGSLFSGGAFAWNAGASVNYPIFRAGAGIAGVEFSQAQRDAALASYERTIQVAFREVSDALARYGTIDRQLGATRNLAAAAADTYRLTDARYRGGLDSFLASLDAQRSLYAAQRTLVGTQLIAASNRVSLYRALGGDATLTAGESGPAQAVEGRPAEGPLPPLAR